MKGGTHVHPHTGAGNYKVRIHLGAAAILSLCVRPAADATRAGLVVPTDPAAELRVHNVTRGWAEGQLVAFDDSFEHEVWFRGDAAVRRAVLIVDMFHPDLTPAQRAQAPRFG